VRAQRRIGLAATLIVVIAIGVGCGGGSSSSIGVDGEPPRAAVPNVIGKPSDAAARILKAHGFIAAFDSLNNGCATVPPSGSIVKQRPDPGTERHTQHRVDVQAACGHGPFPSCREADLALSTNGGSDLSGGTDLIHVDLINTSSRPCAFHGTVRLALRSADGTLAPIRGNPSDGMKPHRVIGSKEKLTALWTWYTWCQSHSLRAVATYGSVRGQRKIEAPGNPCNFSKPTLRGPVKLNGPKVGPPRYEAQIVRSAQAPH
jgi:hypothetical protein